MKKIAAFVCFIIISSTSFSQNQYVDSLQAQLSKTTNATDSFKLIVKISEHNLIVGGGAIDDASVIRLLTIAQRLENDSLLAISYNWIGSYIAFTKGNNAAALDYYFKALPLAEKVKDKRRISSLYFDIALVYFMLQNKEEAVRYVRKGGENLPDTSSAMYPFMLIQYQRNMSQYYLLSHQYDSALYYAQQLTATSIKLKSLSFQYSALYLSGSAYEQTGDTEMAEVYFKKANAMSPLIENKTGRFRFYQIYIGFLLNNGKIDEARKKAAESLQLGEQDNNNNIKLAAAGFLRQAYDSLHQTDSAYYYAKMKDALNDSVFNDENNNKIQELAFNDQLRTIEDNAKAVEEAQQRRQNIQFAIIALGIIIFITIFLLFSRSVVANERMISFFAVLGLLVVFEFINLLLHPWLASVTHESPVLMLLALVVIASLLIPLHHKLEHWIKEKMVEKNKAIRLAAAKKTIEKLEGNKKQN